MSAERIYSTPANDQSFQSHMNDIIAKAPVFMRSGEAAGIQETKFGQASAVSSPPSAAAAKQSTPLKGSTSETTTAYDAPMTSPTSEELALQLKVARLEIDKELLAAKQAEVAFHSEIKGMISSNNEAFQTLRSDVNKAVGDANLNTEKLRAEMHKGFADQQKWFIGILLTIGIALVSQLFKSQEPAKPQATQAPIIINVPGAPTAAPAAPSVAPGQAVKTP